MSLEHKTLGNKIRDLRKRAKLTQADLAKQLGISRSLVAHWETDRPGKVFVHLPKLAELLKVKMSDFLYVVTEKMGGSMSNEEKHLITEYRKLEVMDRIRVQRFMQRITLSKDFFED